MKWLREIIIGQVEVPKEQSLEDIVKRAYAKDTIDYCEMYGRWDIYKKYANDTETLVKIRSILSYFEWNCKISLGHLEYYMVNYGLYDWVGFLIAEKHEVIFDLFSTAHNLEQIAPFVDGDKVTHDKATLRILRMWEFLGEQYRCIKSGETKRLCPLISGLDELGLAKSRLTSENSAMKVSSFKTDEEFFVYLIDKSK